MPITDNAARILVQAILNPHFLGSCIKPDHFPVGTTCRLEQCAECKVAHPILCKIHHSHLPLYGNLSRRAHGSKE